MDKFDDILRNKLNEPITPPDSTPVWAKINAGLTGTGFSRWKSIALLSLLLWLLTITFWYLASNTKPVNTAIKEIPVAKTIVKNDTIIKYKTIIDTVFKKVYITKWKAPSLSNNGIQAEIKPTQFGPKEPIVQETKDNKGDSNLTFNPILKSGSLQSSTMEYKGKMKPLNPLKLAEPVDKKSEPAFDFSFWFGIPKYPELVIQKNSIAPKLNSSIIALSTNYRLIPGFAFYGGITRQYDKYEAAGITNVKNREVPDPGNTAYTLDAITVDQLIWTLNTGLSYDFILKNKWILSISSGIDWNLSGIQDNSYCFPGTGYLPENRIYEHKETKIMTPQKAYLSIGINIPVYKQWSLAYRFNKYINMSSQTWLIPDYSHEFGLKYYFY